MSEGKDKADNKANELQRTWDAETGLKGIPGHGIPEVGHTLTQPCPACGCMTMHYIQVEGGEMDEQGRKQLKAYLSCAACPWSSPAMNINHSMRKGPGRETGSETKANRKKSQNPGGKYLTAS